MPTFNIATPDSGASKEVSVRTNGVSFGDGYKVDVGDGINTVTETWNLNFTLRTKTTITAIDDFLTGLAGRSNFDWTTPQGRTLKFKCKKWTPVYNTDFDCSLSCTFEQDFSS